MNPTRSACALALAGALLTLPATYAQAPATRAAQTPASRVDAAFLKFWAARSPAEAEQTANDVLKCGVSFEEALRRLKKGRSYIAQKSGVVKLSNRTEDKVEHHYAINVPAGYDPSRSYQVRFQLHGGVGGRLDNQPRGTGEIGQLAGAEQFYVIPYAWAEAPWWGDDQILNLNAILDSMKRTYNIDENHVVLSGVSDGGTGAYYIGMRETTPFASILPLNGFLMVLATDQIDDGTLFPNNLRNKPLFVINGGRDRLYPTAITEPFVNHMMAKGVEVSYNPQPDAGHNTAWWPEMKSTFEKFVADHPRNPHPDRLTWETGGKSHTRAHWLVIDQLGAQPGDAKAMPDVNALDGDDDIARFAATPVSLFIRKRYSGRVDLVRTGNTIEATTRGVAAFTLLLSPDRFDFGQPVKVVANGRVVFEGRVEPSLETLLKWAARDNDRTMLYGAELKIKLTR
jgi:hypothetical protein